MNAAGRELVKQHTAKIAVTPQMQTVLDYLAEHEKMDELKLQELGIKRTRAYNLYAHAVTLLLVYYTRKMYDPGPLNTLSGSTGLVGAVDGVWYWKKKKG